MNKIKFGLKIFLIFIISKNAYSKAYSCHSFAKGEVLVVSHYEDILSIVLQDSRPNAAVAQAFAPVLGEEVTRASLQAVFKTASCLEKQTAEGTELTCINYALLDPLFLTKCGVREFDANLNGEYSDSIYTTCAANNLPANYAPFTQRIKSGSFISYRLFIPNLESTNPAKTFMLDVQVYNPQLGLMVDKTWSFTPEKHAKGWKQSTECFDSFGNEY
ncbi:MAG: hypothetical protein KBD78_10095 [Oligoflexales bacterium]|nr:hypothetical protein [Oligoflexales bacterium]